jgi:predicted Fe-Mo cluster-binding NifX family protein
VKIAIACQGMKLESQVDARFGRCPYFLIIDSKTSKFTALKNTAGQAFQGAGISAAQMIADKGVEAVAAGNFGPKALSVLGSAEIKVYAGVSGIKAGEALEKIKKGGLKPLDKTAFSFSGGMGIGRGWGQGRGRGRGSNTINNSQ